MCKHSITIGHTVPQFSQIKTELSRPKYLSVAIIATVEITKNSIIYLSIDFKLLVH